jgi:hypothetical protein
MLSTHLKTRITNQIYNKQEKQKRKKKIKKYEIKIEKKLKIYKNANLKTRNKATFKHSKLPPSAALSHNFFLLKCPFFCRNFKHSTFPPYAAYTLMSGVIPGSNKCCKIAWQGLILGKFFNF